jgi:hypothetical protein
MYIGNPSASFTRPNDANIYAVGDLVANSVTAGSVVPLTLTLANSFGSGVLRFVRARLVKSGTSTTNASFRIHIYQASPTVTNGDNGAWLTDNAANWLGNIDISSMLAFSDGCAGTGSLPAGSEAFVKTASGKNLYALLAALGTYTPANNEVFTLTLEEVDAW